MYTPLDWTGMFIVVQFRLGVLPAYHAIGLLENFRCTYRLRSAVIQFFYVVSQNLQRHIYVVEMRPE